MRAHPARSVSDPQHRPAHAVPEIGFREMMARALDGLRWAAVWAVLATVGCPQLAEDDFSSLPAQSGTGGSDAGAAGDVGAAARGGACTTGVGASGRCGLGAAGSSSPSDDAGTDASSAAPDAGDGCLAGTQRGPNGDCYYSDSTATTWLTARASCRLLGAGWDLATIRSAAENAFVASLTGYEAWLGATDGITEGEWIWVRDELPFFEMIVGDAGSAGAGGAGAGDSGAGAAFTSWNGGEPNNYDNSDCLRQLPTGLWADRQCTALEGRVCQQTTP